MGSIDGAENARVAPSGLDGTDGIAGGFGMTGVGIGKDGGAGDDAIGCGGAGGVASGGFDGEGKTDAESFTELTGGAAEAGDSGPRVRISGSLNHPVNPVPDPDFFADSAGTIGSGCADTAPNTSVKPPTDLWGGSLGIELTGGTSDGTSGRNGPWKKLVNSPALALFFGAEGVVSLEKLFTENSEEKKGSGGFAAGAGGVESSFGEEYLPDAAVSHDGAACSPDGCSGSSRLGTPRSGISDAFGISAGGVIEFDPNSRNI